MRAHGKRPCYPYTTESYFVKNNSLGVLSGKPNAFGTCAQGNGLTARVAHGSVF